jgi:Mn2+/Fe2+ NRAMP family transporter
MSDTSPTALEVIELASGTPAVLDGAHIGDIQGAFGTIRQGDTTKRTWWSTRLATLMAILGPGLIVMVGDNDAGAFGTYTQAGQNYGNSLLWTLMLLIPVLYVNQEMVARLGAVTGVGHARLIFERFGKFWGSFSIIDLVMLNALTIVTEFIGVTIVLNYFGLPKIPGLIGAAALIIGAASTGSFRRFERFAMVLVVGSLLLLPVLHEVHPPLSQMVYGAIAMMAFCAEMFAGKPEFGNFTDAGGVLTALHKYVDTYPAAIFAIALLDASLIGAAAVSLATSYAIADVFRVRHSLHRNVTDATGFYAAYGVLIAVAAAIVVFSSDAFLGFLTNAVQALAGVLLPSATVFLLLLCNDKAVAGPWTNGPKLNVFTGAVIWVLVLLSVILTVSTVFPNISGQIITEILVGGSIAGVLGFLVTIELSRGRRSARADRVGEPMLSDAQKRNWRMPPLDRLPPRQLTLATKVWMGVLRGYLLIAVILIAFWNPITNLAASAKDEPLGARGRCGERTLCRAIY